MKHSLNYLIGRLCNYLIINISKFLPETLEAGINVSDKNIDIHISIPSENFNKSYKFLEDYLEVIKNDEKNIFIVQNKLVIKTFISSNKFSNKLIKELNNYYFNPIRTNNKYIFKYSPVNNNLFKLLINNELWFSDPSKFNDPFEFRVHMECDLNEEEELRFYYKIEKQNSDKNSPLSLKDFKNKFKKKTKAQLSKDLEQHHYKNSFVDKIGICCFSENYKNKLMWSHYAHNAKGVCLVFDTTINPDVNFFQFIGNKVNYRAETVKRFFDGSPYYEITNIIYTKNKIWKYENEIREINFFEKGTQNRSVKFDPKSLVGIIFGSKINENDKTTLINLINQLGKYKIEFIDSFIDLKNSTIITNKSKLKLKSKAKIDIKKSQQIV